MTIVLDGSGGISAPIANMGNFVGQVCFFASSSAPSGFLKANGASLSTTTYAALFAVIGYTYGGSGASFNLPDLRGEFIRGWDDARGVDNGRGFGSAQGDAFKSHTHSLGYYMDDDNGNNGYIGVTDGDNFASANYPSGATGGTETRPRNVALLACIKY